MLMIWQWYFLTGGINKDKVSIWVILWIKSLNYFTYWDVSVPGLSDGPQGDPDEAWAKPVQKYKDRCTKWAGLRAVGQLWICLAYNIFASLC